MTGKNDPRTHPINLLFFLALGAASLTFRQVATRLPEGFMGLPAIWNISVLQVWIWYELLLYSYAEKVSVDTWVAILFASFLIICALLYPDIAYGFDLLSALVLFMFFSYSRPCLIIAFSLILIVFGGLFSSSLFSFLHSSWAYFDAATVWLILSLIGTQIQIDGTVLHLPGSDHSIVVEATCASTWVLTLPIICFLIVTLCRQGKFERPDILRFALATAVVFSLNIFRLSKMLSSREAWEYWHFGNGSSIFALGSALVILILVRGRPNEI